ncbi:MAG TPA: TRAP transporter large permease subunit [Dehalococcoidia bacterium]|nr:TRAP transporter large permease subunit [Dehalococcoidia bacterium]
MLGLLFLGIMSGYPIAFIMAGVGFAVGLVLMGPGVFGMALNRTYAVMTNYVLLAAPMFVFMGMMLGRSGCAERLYATLHVILGGLRGGLLLTTILIATLFAAATGIIGASVVTIGLLAMPSMLGRGYNKSLASGAVCAGGTLGILIPPSIMIVIYGSLAALSVAKLFAAAIVPGLVLSALYQLYVLGRCYFNPKLGPPLPLEERRAVPTRVKVVHTFTRLLPPIFLILAVLGTIFAGIATPTEAAAMGAFASCLVAASYRKFNWQTLKETIIGTMRVTCFIAMLVIGIGIFSGVFMHLGGGKVITELLLAAPGGKWGAFSLVMIIVFFLGMLMEWIGSIFIIVPLFTPVAAELGMDPIWFAMCVIVMYQTSFLTPPVAHAIFYLKSVAPPEVTMGDIIRGIVPFVGLILVGLTLVVIFPDLILWLPGIIIGR